MARRTSVSFLGMVAVSALLTAPPVHGAEPAILLHVAEPTRFPCGMAPTEGEAVATVAPIEGEASEFLVYILGQTGDNMNGLAGLQSAIEYSDGLEAYGWASCADLYFATEDWPASGSSNTVTWDYGQNCQRGLAVAGYIEVTVTRSAVIQVIPFPPTGLLKLADCSVAEYIVDEDMRHRLGWISFGGGARGLDTDGCNPLLESCDDSVPAETATWGGVKTSFRD